MPRLFPEIYKKGFYKGQKEDGINFNDLLYQNLEVLADGIYKDNSFLLLVSAKALSVRTGKSSFTQLFSVAWIHILYQKFGITNLTFNMDNVAFNADQFEEKAFKLHQKGQKFAPIILDESDDLTGHSLSQEVTKIKRFLRKSGQLNLLMIMILPDFFEFPKSIAVSRSVGLLTVDFGEKFERGNWEFYDYKAKKKLYIQGKKFEDYSVVQPTLYGRFVNCGYLVDEDQYRKEKYADLKEDSDKQKAKRIEIIKKELLTSTFKRLVEKLHGRITIKEIAECFLITKNTATAWLKTDTLEAQAQVTTNNNINASESNDVEGGGADERENN